MRGGGGFEAERALAGSLNAQGRFDEGDVIFRGLAVKARTDSERVDAARGRATSLGGAGRLAEAESMLTQLRAQIDEEALRRRLDMVLCVVASQSGRLADAIRGLRPLVADERADLDRRVEAASWLAGVLALSGRSEEALSLTVEWEPFLHDEGDPTRRRLVPLAMLTANFHEARIRSLVYAGRLAGAAAAVERASAAFAGTTPGEFAASSPSRTGFSG